MTRRCALGDIADIRQGRYLAKEDMSESRTLSTPIPVHGANGIIGWTSRPMYEDGVPLVTCRGSNSGMVLWADGPLWVSNNAMAILPHGGESRFAFYALLNSPPFDVVSGSAQPQITRSALSPRRYEWPAEAQREGIAAVLSALDDKIELNRRMNETLEASAWTLFRDWFVDFGPTRAKAEGRPAYLAPELWSLFPDRLDDDGVPEGWKKGTVSDAGEIVCGKTPSTREPANFGSDIPFVTIPDMHNEIYTLKTAKSLSTAGARSQLKKMIPANSICVSCIASPGLVTITTELSQTNQQINSVVPHASAEVGFWFWTLRYLGDDIKQAGSGGSVLSNLSTSRFAALPVMLSSAALRKAYSRSIEPIFSNILENKRESRTLAATRDALLPKLMSGEIRVRDAEALAA